MLIFVVTFQPAFAGDLPTGLRHARQLPVKGQAAETDTTQTELAEEPARPPATQATIMLPDLEFRLAPTFCDPCRCCHFYLPGSSAAAVRAVTS